MGAAAGSPFQHSLKHMNRKIAIPVLVFLTLIVAGLLVTRTKRNFRELSQAEFTGMVQSNLLAKVQLYYPPKPGQLDGVPVMLHKVRGTFYQTDAAGQILKAQGPPVETPFIARVQLTPELEEKLTRSSNFSVVTPNALAQKAGTWFDHSK
jgi:hypothetical protein